jgi:hypothetical protein
MINSSPIPSPPPELVEQWARHILTPEEGGLALDLDWFANQAARWGADQELEACCKWLDKRFQRDPFFSKELRTARRPKPLSLKEQALAALRQVGNCEEIDNVTFETIRHALEALPND